MQKRVAFSLVEMLIVMVIVSILAAMAVPLMTAKRKYEAKKTSTTASLRIRSVGEHCDAVTSGTALNQTADENIAIKSDRTALLTCQTEATVGGACSTIGAEAVSISGDVVTRLVCQ